jgi:hypothetical protein
LDNVIDIDDVSKAWNKEFYLLNQKIFIDELKVE